MKNLEKIQNVTTIERKKKLKKKVEKKVPIEKGNESLTIKWKVNEREKKKTIPKTTM